jgi:succinate dehydrogenase/fumarate reductase cytochrome b subunit
MSPTDSRIAPPSERPRHDASGFVDRHEALLRRAQRITGLVMSLFLGIHLLNQVAAVGGADFYTPLQRALRPLYQAPLVELSLVIGPLLVHGVIGVALAWRRRRQPPGSSWRLRLHRYAGRVLALFVVGHVVATRGPSLVCGVYPEFEGVALTLLVLPGVFYPYYVLLGVAGVVHGVFGVALVLPGITRGRGAFAGRTIVVVSVGFAAAVVAGVLGFGGAFTPVDTAAVRRSPIAGLAGLQDR